MSFGPTAFSFTKDQETALTNGDNKPVAAGIEEVQKPAATLRSVLATSLKLTDEELSAADAGDKITGAIAAKDTSISELTTRAEAAEGEVKTLKAAAKTVDELADTKSREIAARAHAPLPPKAPGAGNKVTDDGDKSKPTGTPRERLGAHFESQLKKA